MKVGYPLRKRNCPISLPSRAIRNHLYVRAMQDRMIQNQNKMSELGMKK